MTDPRILTDREVEHAERFHSSGITVVTSFGVEDRDDCYAVTNGELLMWIREVKRLRAKVRELGGDPA